jgi:hypothetical protein
MTSATAFEGFWLLHDPSEVFLSNRKNDTNHGISEPLGRISDANTWERFVLAFDDSAQQVQIQSKETGHYLAANISTGVVAFSSKTPVWFDCSDEGGGRFSLAAAGTQSWLCWGRSYYTLTSNYEARTVLTPIRQGTGSSIGDLGVGEAAVFSDENFGGTGWIFCQPYSDFTKISGLNDTAKSIRLGPQAGATLWENQYSGKVMDFGVSQAKLSAAGFAEKSASAIEVWQMSTPSHTLAEGEAVLYRQTYYTGPGRLVQHDVDVLHRYSTGSLRLGPDTLVTLYSNRGQSGTSQPVLASIQSFADGMTLGTAGPKSLSIGSAPAPEYTGSWGLQRAGDAATLGQGCYLSVRMDQVVGASSARPIQQVNWISTWERLAIVPVNSDGSRVRLYTEDRQLELQAYGQQLLAMTSPSPNVFVRIAEDDGTWSLQSAGMWVSFAYGNFTMTRDETARERFRFIKAAASETSVGALEPGEVAVYELPNYRGRVFVLDRDDVIPSTGDSGGAVSMQVHSVRFGAHTGGWLYRDRACTDVVAALEESHSMLGAAGTATPYSALKIWTLLDVGSAPFEVESVLMEDYSGDSTSTQLQTQKSYRVVMTPRNPAVDNQVEVCITDMDVLVRWNGTQANTTRATRAFPLNPMGQVALSMLAQDIHICPLLVRVPSMAPNQFVLVYPDEQVHRMLSSIEGTDLTRSDKPLVEGCTPDQAEATASAIRNLAGAITGGYRGDARRNSPATPTSVRLTHGSARAASAGMRSVRGCAIDNWGLNFDTQGFPTYFEGTAGSTARSVSSQVAPGGGQVFDSLSGALWPQLWSSRGTIQSVLVTTPTEATVPRRARSWIGNLWKKLVVTIEYLVQEGANLVRKVAAFVLDTVQAVTDMITGLFAQLGAAVDKVVHWLSALFDWDDILRTRDALRTQAESTFADLKAAMPTLEQRILDALDSAEGRLNAVLDQVATNLRNQPMAGVVAPFAGPASNVDQSRVQSDWLMSTTLEQPQSIQEGALSPTPTALSASIDDFFASIRDAFNTPEAQAAFTQAQTIFQQAFSAPSVTQALKDVLAAVITLVRGVADIAIQVAEAVVRGVFQLAQASFDLVYGWLTQPINIPVVTPLFSRIAGGAQLNIVELGLLMAAVPVTIAYKLAHDNQPPFPAEAARAMTRSLGPGDPFWGKAGGGILLMRAACDFAVDVAVIASRNDGRAMPSTDEKLTSSVLLVLTFLAQSCIRPGDGTAAHSFAFWLQPRPYQQNSAVAWDWQWLGFGVQIASMALSKRLTRSNFQYLGSFLDMGFGITSFALACAIFAEESGDPTAGLSPGGYHFAENTMECLPSIVKPLILTRNAYADTAVLACDLLPAVSGIMRMLEG